MPLLQNQPAGPATIISTIQGDENSGASVKPFEIAALVIALLGVLLFGYRLLSLQAKVREATTQRDQLVSEYSSLADVKKQVTEVSALATGLQVAYAAQTPIVDLMKVVQSTSLKQAKYDSVSINKKGEVRITGTVGTYRDFAQLVKAFKGSEDGTPGITKNVTISSVTQAAPTEKDATGPIVTNFSISFMLLPAAMGKDAATTTGGTQ